MAQKRKRTGRLNYGAGVWAQDPLTRLNNADPRAVRLGPERVLGLTMLCMGAAMRTGHDAPNRTRKREQQNHAYVELWKLLHACGECGLVTKCSKALLRKMQRKNGMNTHEMLALGRSCKHFPGKRPPGGRGNAFRCFHLLGFDHLDTEEKAQQDRSDNDRSRAFNYRDGLMVVLHEIAKCQVVCDPCNLWRKGVRDRGLTLAQGRKERERQEAAQKEHEAILRHRKDGTRPNPKVDGDWVLSGGDPDLIRG